MQLIEEALTDENLDDVMAFFREANPFAQHTWGWDTGRFIDWRWGSNVHSERDSPGWFASNCRVFRTGGAVVAIALAETGRGDVFLITPVESDEIVRYLLGWLPTSSLAVAEDPFRLDVAEHAVWLRALFVAAGMTEERNSGVEWEYDLAAVETDASIPEGFVVESLAVERPVDLGAISECIGAAFGSHHDMTPTLESISSNPMYRPELSVYARTGEGRVAAYCRGTIDPVTGVCGIDPVCTHPEYGRLGLAKAVVRACFRTQRDLGGRFSYIGSAPEPEPSTFLYRSLGPAQTFPGSTWTLPTTLTPS